MNASRSDENGVLTIVLPGKPIGKPRFRRRDFFRRRQCMIDYHAFCEHLRWIARPILDANSVERLDWTAYFEPPPSWSEKKRASMLGKQHRQVPDRDNIDKAILDALWPRSKKIFTGGKGDDSAIAVGAVEKFWGEESYLEIRITHGGPA